MNKRLRVTDLSKSGNTYSRVLSSLLFDASHIDSVTLIAYLDFLSTSLHSRIVRAPDFSSEVLHWRRVYHENRIKGIPVGGEVRPEHCKASIQFALNRLREKFHEQLKLIEVGCGPTSQFYTKDLSNHSDLSIITVDPLAEFYNELHNQYKTGYDIECVVGYGENLKRQFAKESFHLVYSQNAIDHSMSPVLFMNNLYEILKHDGYLILHGFIKEGSTARWLGLHKWDIEVENNDLLLTNRPRSIYKKSITSHLQLTAVFKKVEGNAYTFIYKKNNHCSFNEGHAGNKPSLAI